jgi:AbiJ N-terminal domain 4
MAITNLYSKRQKEILGELPDIYEYDYIPQKLRGQIFHIIQESIGEFDDLYSTVNARNYYKIIHDTLAREYGKISLNNATSLDFIKEDPKHKIATFIFKCNCEEMLDLVEVSFDIICNEIKKDKNPNYYTLRKLNSEEAVSELNIRSKENAIGYCFENGQIIRIDSTLLHSEITLPALSFLSDTRFSGANQEFLKAHEHYRHSRNKECLNECLKAFESTMKIICKEKSWAYDEQKDTASKLIQICLDNGLIPNFVQGQFTALKSLLDSGIPPIRNRNSGHGQGQVPQNTPDEITRYCLNLTGANIVFLVEQSGIK